MAINPMHGARTAGDKAVAVPLAPNALTAYAPVVLALHSTALLRPRRSNPRVWVGNGI